MSSGLASRATATSVVRARSAAEIPVVTPSRASIDMVKLVPWAALLLSTIRDSPNWSQRWAVRVRQIRPRALLAIKFISSARTIEAAMIKSPSFSRSSSSISTTILPRRMSSISSSTVFRFMFCSYKFGLSD